MSETANDAWDCDHHPEWADRRNVCHHPDHVTPLASTPADNEADR